jgi:hypothetical protein
MRKRSARYRFDGTRLVARDAWVSTSSAWRTWVHPTEEGHARATLYRLIDLLDRGEHPRAAALYGGHQEDLARLVDGCPQRRFPAIEGIVPMSRRRGATFEFTVRLRETDRTLRFDVRKTGGGWRVVYLPTHACDHEERSRRRNPFRAVAGTLPAPSRLASRWPGAFRA